MDNAIRNKVLGHFGNQHRMSKVLSVSRQAVSKWFIDECIPPKHALMVEIMMDGEVKATDLSCGLIIKEVA